MNDNDVEMVRVFTRQVNSDVADISYAHNDQFEIVVEAEAGQSKFNDGGPYRFDITVRCLTHNMNIELHEEITGNLAEAAGINKWDQQKKQFKTNAMDCEHLLPGGKWNDCFEVLAVLSVGRLNPDISIARSPLFVCHKA